MSDSPQNAPQSCPIAPVATLQELFLVCLKIGLTSFGGGLSGWFYREFVLQRKWITDEEFASTFAISQMLPGANITNFVVSIGEQLRGFKGSLACILGLVIGPFFALIGISTVFDMLSDLTRLAAISTGVAFSAIGLLIMICLRGVRRALPRPEMVAIIAATGLAVGIMQWSLPLVVLALAPLSIFFAWRRM